MSNDETRKAHQFGSFWDMRLRGSSPNTGDSELAEIVERLEAENRRVSLGQAQQDAIWSAVIAGAVESLPKQAPSPGTPAQSQFALATGLTRFLHAYAWLLCAGFAGGFMAGVGSRLMMRLAGILTVDSNRFMLTENDAQVGEVTLGGTLTLGIIGAALGVFALLIYVLIRDRLPFDGWKRSVTFAWLLFLVFGYVVMDPSNPDYQRFGPAWMNVVTFSSLYLVMGVCVVQAYEFGIRWSAERAPIMRDARWAMLKTVLATAVCGIGTLLLTAGLFLGTAAALIPLLAAATWAIGRVIGPGLIAKVQIPYAIRQWGAWVVPGIVGFILTARGVTEILLNR